MNNDKSLTIKIIEAYLIHGLAQRDIQESILGIDAPIRGGGFKAMTILHELGITGEKKGILKYKDIDDEIKNASGEYRNTLLKYYKYLKTTKYIIPISSVKASISKSIEQKRFDEIKKMREFEFNHQKTINIKGVQVPLYKSNDETIQDFVKKILRLMFKNDLLPNNEIENMLNEDYCIKTFGIDKIFGKYYPIIQNNINKLRDDYGHLKYYKDEIAEIQGKKYYACSQWWKSKEDIYKTKFSNWIKNIAKINGEEIKDDDLDNHHNDEEKSKSKQTKIIEKQQRSSYEIAQNVREIILSINENCKLNKKKDIFDQSALFKLWGNIEKSCKSKNDFKNFAENIYKLLRETTRYKNPNKKNNNDPYYIFLIPNNFIKKEPTKHFWDIVNTLRQYFIHDEIGNIAEVNKEFLGSSSGPESQEDYSKLQIEVLKLFENSMKILLDIVKNELNPPKNP
jgi:hypothetical protein